MNIFQSTSFCQSSSSAARLAGCKFVQSASSCALGFCNDGVQKRVCVGNVRVNADVSVRVGASLHWCNEVSVREKVVSQMYLLSAFLSKTRLGRAGFRCIFVVE